jgi:hypothetical protein
MIASVLSMLFCSCLEPLLFSDAISKPILVSLVGSCQHHRMLLFREEKILETGGRLTSQNFWEPRTRREFTAIRAKRRKANEF